MIFSGRLPHVQLRRRNFALVQGDALHQRVERVALLRKADPQSLSQHQQGHLHLRWTRYLPGERYYTDPAHPRCDRHFETGLSNNVVSTS